MPDDVVVAPPTRGAAPRTAGRAIRLVGGIAVAAGILALAAPPAVADPEVDDRAPTTTTLAADNPSLVSGQAVTFTASVAPATVTVADAGDEDPGDPVPPAAPSGTVAFELGDGSVLPGCDAVALDASSQAQCAVTGGFAASASPVSVQAVYSGDDAYANSGSDAVVLDVAKAGTSVTVTANPDPPVRGQVTTFTAAVAALAPGSGTPSGAVTFSITAPNGIAVDCTGGNTVELTDGSADCVTPKNTLLGRRNYTVDVSYAGDDDYEAQTGSLAQSVARAGASVSVEIAPASPTTGSSVSIKATVDVEGDGSGRPNGTVTFTVTGESGTEYACRNGNTVTLARTGVAPCVIAAGTLTAADSYYTVAAEYSGSRSYYPSYGRRSLTIGRGASSTAVSQSSTSSAVGRPVTFTATVTPARATAAPLAGTVTFTVTDKAGTAVACDGDGTVAADGTSSCTVAGSALTAPGQYTALAAWSGDVNYTRSQGRVVHRVVSRQAD